MYSQSLVTLLFSLTTFPLIKSAYDSLLFTEDFFPLINARLDPIVTPNKVSGHVHHVVGSSAFSAGQDYASSRDANCTSSNLSADKSNFWAPQLYYKWRNGTYTAITGDGMTAYWKYPLTNTDASDPFATIPDDFRMLAGDIKRDDYDANKAVSFLCVDANHSYDYTDYMPTNRECLTLRPQLHFPECWNGVDAFKEDNSHVAYPVDANPEGGKCPDGFNKIPHLFLESTYHIKTENIGEGYEWYPGCFVLANGDNHGFSYHSDWLNGFPSGFLTEAFHQCYDTASGIFIQDCPYIQRYRGDIGRDCNTEGDVINEHVGQHVAIASLPGNNPEYNSSKASTDYPKKSIAGYTEKASIVKASDTLGGFCVQGTCTDYIGSDAITQEGPGEAVSIGSSSIGTGNDSPSIAATATATDTSVGGSSGSSSDTLSSTATSNTGASGTIMTDLPGSTGNTTPLAAIESGVDSATIQPVGSFTPVTTTDSSSTAATSTAKHRWAGGQFTRRSGMRRLLDRDSPEKELDVPVLLSAMS
ncbi:uncharacterized protein IL334_001910 [Kwoniella shivajii]|uniref:DUF1996 domain-containing protein n=1 Tax=Kwoniella shivajii TaxID=564305 RepID=A0ABZ1CUV3_9TREE|nr:hypothetical protein IL334_001910 [Kwoniella shivajii]